MSFLRSLAQRAVQPAASGLRPRVASRFEAEAAPARLVEEHVETEARPGPATWSAAAPAPIERPAPPATTGRASEVPATAAPLRPDVAPVRPEAPTTAPAPPALAPPLVAAAPPPAVAPAASLAATPAPLAAPLLPPASTLLVEHSVERVIETRHEIETRVAAADAPHAEARTVTPRAATPALVPVVAPAWPEPAPAADAPRAAPTVHVTIGRIDVRAVHAPPPPPAPVAAAPPTRAPALTLDEYLARRAAP